MTQTESFMDWLNIHECYQELKRYKLGEIDEKECLIFIAKRFQELDKK